MSNSTRVTARHSLSAMVAVAAIIALVVGMFLATNGTAASGAEVGAYASSESASDTPTASSTVTASSEPVYPKVQGWKHTRNQVKYHIFWKKGVVDFWTVKEGGSGWLLWPAGRALAGSGAGFIYGQVATRVRFKKCGVRTAIDIGGYELTQRRHLPAWPCRYAKK